MKNTIFKEKLLPIILNNKKKTATAIVLIFISAGLVFSDYGIINRISLRRELKEKDEQIISENETVDSLKQIVNQLQNDSLEIERIARENYGMAKSNEEVCYIKKSKQ